LAGPHAAAASPSALSELIKFAISMAVMAASPPLLPTLPPARSSACVGGWVGGGGGAHTDVPFMKRHTLAAGCLVALTCYGLTVLLLVIDASTLCQHTRVMQALPRHTTLDDHSTKAGDAPYSCLPSPHLLHCVTGQHTKHNRDTCTASKQVQQQVRLVPLMVCMVEQTDTTRNGPIQTWGHRHCHVATLHCWTRTLPSQHFTPPGN
jgi:hypothetical protein